MMAPGSDADFAAGLEIVAHGAGGRFDRGFLHRVVAATLRYLKRPQLQVALLLTGDEEIAALHARFLGNPSSTDVISFGEPGDDAVDVVVNVELAAREASRREVDVAVEVALYVVHGLLHCGGHDDHAADDRRRMREAEREVLSSLGLHHAPVDE